MLTRIVALVAAFAAAPLLADSAAAQTGSPAGQPLTTGGDGTMVLHCNALGLPGFVGAIVVNRNGEFGRCHFVHVDG